MTSNAPNIETSVSQLACVGRLKDQVALVTGASSGIGKGIALAMADEGAQVVVNYHSHPDSAQETVREVIARGSRAFAVQANVGRESEVQAMFREVIHEFGTIDILVSNSGIQRDAPFDQMSLEYWQEVIDTNLTGAFLCAREAVREFKRRGVIEGRSLTAGKIIFISSVHEIIPWATHCNYAAAKGGLLMLMKSLAQEVAPAKIRVNGIAPGAIRTPINRNAWETPEAEERLLRLIPWKRVGDVRDVGSVAVWLASDESDYVHGATIYVDGGMTLYPGFSTGG